MPGSEAEWERKRVPDESPGRCPVCRAPFREKRQCPRCGADLSRLMWLAVRLWQRRVLHGDEAQNR